jgi:hypothetical protein
MRPFSQLQRSVHTRPETLRSHWRNREPETGNPDALLKWFYPGRVTGNEFVYSKQKEKELAQDKQQTIVADQRKEPNFDITGAGDWVCGLGIRSASGIRIWHHVAECLTKEQLNLNSFMGIRVSVTRVLLMRAAFAILVAFLFDVERETSLACVRWQFCTNLDIGYRPSPRAGGHADSRLHNNPLPS